MDYVNQNDIQTCLKNCLLLSPMSEAGCNFLCKYIEVVELDVNQILFTLLDKIDFVYILLDGELSLREGDGIGNINDTFFKVIDKPGNSVGASYTNPKANYLYCAVANTPSKLIKISHDIYQKYHIQYSETESLVKQIRSFPLYAKFSFEECMELISQTEHIRLNKDDVLFHQGDPSDSMYVVIKGSLSANLQLDEYRQKLIGVIEAGEPIGELGTISDQPRTLTVIAVSDCYLLKISQQRLEIDLLKFPHLMLEMMRKMIKRSQTTIAMLKDGGNIKTLVLAPVENTLTYYEFFTQLKRYISSTDENVKLFEIIDDNVNPLELFIQQNWKNNKIVIVYIANLSIELLKKINNYITKFFLITIPELNVEFEQNITDSLHELSLLKIRTELILYHQSKLISNTKLYIDKHKFDLHHHIIADNFNDFERLTRFLLYRTCSLVLGGGGAKIWVHVGVLKALIEAKIPIDAIGGTSAGSFVAAAYALDQTYEAVYERVHCLMSAIHPVFVLKNFTLPVVSLVNGVTLTNVIENLFGGQLIEDMHIPYFCISCDLNIEHEVVHRSGPVSLNVRSSCSLPGILPPVVRSGHMYVDGSLLNNLPVDTMIDMIGSKQKVIAVSLSDAFMHDNNKYFFPPTFSLFEALLYKLGIGYKSYKVPQYFETFLKSMLVGASVRERENGANASILISPDLVDYGVLNVRPTDEKLLIDKGYQEAIKQLS